MQLTSIVQTAVQAQTPGTVQQPPQKPPVSEAQSKQPTEATEKGTPLDQRQLKEVVEAVGKTIQGLAQDLEFSVDEDTGANIVRIIDRETHQVIRQIPSEEMLAIAKRLDELQGLLFRQKA